MGTYKLLIAEKFDADLKIVEDAIRAKNNVSGDLTFPHGMAEAIYDINTNTDKLQQIADGSVTEITADDLKGITKIKRYMFEDCPKLESITIPEGVTEIGYRMCYEDTSLKSITIPDSVTSLGSSSFYGCTSLETVRLSNKLNMIDYRMFKGCSKLKNITIPNSVTSIGELAFSKCTGLTSVTIPDSVTSIGVSAFEYCTGLTSVTIGNSVTFIGGWAFDSCPGLKEVKLLATTPPKIESYTFSYVYHVYAGYPFYVPANSVEAYKTATNWSEYADRIFAIEE